MKIIPLLSNSIYLIKMPTVMTFLVRNNLPISAKYIINQQTSATLSYDLTNINKSH